MKEKSLVKIAITCSFVGLFLVLLFSKNYETKEKDISEVKINDYNYARISGTVGKIIETDKMRIIEISKTETMKIIVFTEYPLEIKKGDYLEAKGKVETYKGEKEIIADEIRIFK